MLSEGEVSEKSLEKAREMNSKLESDLEDLKHQLESRDEEVMVGLQSSPLDCFLKGHKGKKGHLCLLILTTRI